MGSSNAVETQDAPLRAAVVHPFMTGPRAWPGESSPERSLDAQLEEACGLTRAIGLHIAVSDVARLAHPSPAFLFGSGWVETWAGIVKAERLGLVIINHVLTPTQQRNLERVWACKVIDRTGLILEIFGARARTREGQLQVELAALSYQKSRLVRSWTHLERQRGGHGFLGGPGESQIELDRRNITERIARLKVDLAQVRRTRGLQRSARTRAERSIVALVGYTNAGKSTLFNRLTGASVPAQDLLFATLDPHVRGLALPSGRACALSDTVGFIADLPTSLVEAFRATLEEVTSADLIIHVRDIAHPDVRDQKAAVESVLAELGIAPDDPRLIEVWTKADLLDEGARHAWRARASSDELGEGPDRAVLVSARTGEGIEAMLALVDARLTATNQVYGLEVPLTDGAALAWLYAHGDVRDRHDKRTHTRLHVALSEADLGRFLARFPGRRYRL